MLTCYPLTLEKLKEYAIEESSSLTNLSPLATLKEAATLMAQKGGVRRLPLIEQNPDTGQDLVVCVLTQYRLIRFIATNVCISLIALILVNIVSAVITVKVLFAGFESGKF